MPAGGARGDRPLSLTPWRSRTIVGSACSVYQGHADSARFDDLDVARLARDVALAYPSAAFTADDVEFVHVGLLPATRDRRGGFQPAARARVADHARDGAPGLMSVTGADYAAARDGAERAIDLAMERLGRPVRRSASGHTPLYGGRLSQPLERASAALRREWPLIPDAVPRRAASLYGSTANEMLGAARIDERLADTLPGSQDVLAAEVLYASRQEMAIRLSDVVFRRTGLGSAGYPGRPALEACAHLMAEARGWSVERTAHELDAVEAEFTRYGVRLPVKSDEPWPIEQALL